MPLTEKTQQEPSAFRWGQDRIQENERFRASLNKTELRKELFSEKFMDALEKRHDALVERHRKSMLVTGLAFLLLAIALLAVNIPVSLFGISASNAGNLRELLLVLITIIPLFTLMGSIEQARIADTMKLWILRASRGDEDIERVLLLRYGLSAVMGIEALPQAGLSLPTWSAWRKARVAMAFVVGVLWFILSIGILFALEIWCAFSILMHPTVSFGFSVLVIIYVVCAQIVNYGLRLAAGIGSGQTRATS